MVFDGRGAARTSRPFFALGARARGCCALCCFTIATASAQSPAELASAAARIPGGVATGAAQVSAVIAAGLPGSQQIRLLDCATGAVLARASLPAALAAPPALAPDGRSLYAATAGRELQRYSLPNLTLRARAPLAFDPLVVAASGGPDAVVLAGGRGAEPLSAHDPESLEELQRYRTRQAATVSALFDNRPRLRFAVGFADLPEVWEIAYERNAPPVLHGLVHDYRGGEAVSLPGRLTARPFRVAGPTRAFAAGPAPFELARIDASGALGILNLDVRREIERPALAAPGSATLVAPWRAPGARGWLIGAPQAAELTVLESASWRISGKIVLPGPPTWLVSPGDAPTAIALYRAGEHQRAVRVHVATGALVPLAEGLADVAPARAAAVPDGSCVAALDAEERWIVSFAREAPQTGRQHAAP